MLGSSALLIVSATASDWGGAWGSSAHRVARGGLGSSDAPACQVVPRPAARPRPRRALQGRARRGCRGGHQGIAGVAAGGRGRAQRSVRPGALWAHLPERCKQPPVPQLLAPAAAHGQPAVGPDLRARAQAFLDLSLLDAPNVKAPFLQAKKQGQAALLAYSRSTLQEQTVKGFQTKGKVWPHCGAAPPAAALHPPPVQTGRPPAGCLTRRSLVQAVQEDRAERLERTSQLMRAQLAQLEEQSAVSWPSPLSPLQQCAARPACARLQSGAARVCTQHGAVCCWQGPGCAAVVTTQHRATASCCPGSGQCALPHRVQHTLTQSPRQALGEEEATSQALHVAAGQGSARRST